MSKQPDEKQFSLKGTELNMISNCNMRHNAELVDLFSYIALERLNYPVTENTEFRTDEKGDLFIKERPEEAKEEEVKVA